MEGDAMKKTKQMKLYLYLQSGRKIRIGTVISGEGGSCELMAKKKNGVRAGKA